MFTVFIHNFIWLKPIYIYKFLSFSVEVQETAHLLSLEAQILINCLTRANCSNSTMEDVGKFLFKILQFTLKYSI